MRDRGPENYSAQPPGAPSGQDQMSLFWLIGAAVVTMILWQVPYGNYLLYPFSILATWFHEMGHGVMAMMLGGNFDHLVIFPDGSGIAFHNGGLFLGNLGRALVAAAGPLGPAFAGATLILASRQTQTARIGLYVLGGLLLLSTLIWVRSFFGFLMMPLIAAGILAIAYYGSRWLQGFVVQFLGVQACISTFHQVDYLFTYSATIGGQSMLSDSAQVGQQLLLPFWFWGGLMAIGSFALLVQSLRVAYRL